MSNFEADQAYKIARKFADSLSRRWGDEANYQLPPLVYDLCEKAVAETLRQGDGARALDRRLEWVATLISDLVLAAETSRDRSTGDSAKRKTIWTHHKLLEVYKAGTEHPGYYDTMPDEISYVFETYAREPWARAPFIEWALLDMLVMRESCVFGEEAKMRILPGDKDWLGVNTDYHENHGNLAKMRGGFFRSIGRGLKAMIAPAVLIGGAVALGYGGAAPVILGLWSVLLALGIRDERRVKAGVDKILLAMHDVNVAMEPGLLSPQHVKAALLRAKDVGVQWPNAVWPIIDSVIAKDPNIWSVEIDRTAFSRWTALDP